MLLNEKIDNFIKEKLLEIINYNDDDWNKLDINLKTKILHNYCNKFLKQNIECELKIPLKSLKPKKIIQFCNFSKQHNKEIYKSYLENVLNYTFKFRENYKNCKEKKYFNYAHLKEIERDEILFDLNKIVFNTINNNKNYINKIELYNQLLLNNKDKICLINNNFNIEFELNKNEIKIILNENIIFILKLILTGDKITNNIPVKYNINLLNKIIK